MTLAELIGELLLLAIMLVITLGLFFLLIFLVKLMYVLAIWSWNLI